ncbi:MAG TPA: FAD synthase [Candidatus Altiarchaeales archaeon]|nr:FAD synthase [Candidatus Altiarchaeales archaeon]
MVLVAATGVFEIIHPGHLLYLEESRRLGDQLVVILATDKTVKKVKGRDCVPQEHRRHVLKALRIVDDVVVGGDEDRLNTLRKVDPDVLTVGFDQEYDIQKLQEEIREAGLKAKVVKIEKHWEGRYNSSGKIREALDEENL